MIISMRMPDPKFEGKTRPLPPKLNILVILLVFKATISPIEFKTRKQLEGLGHCQTAVPTT